MRKPLLRLAGLALLTASLGGCRHCCDRPVRPGSTVVPPPVPVAPAPAAGCPPPAPAAAVPAAPPPAWPAAPAAPPPVPSVRNYAPPAPAPDVRLAPPEVTSPEPPLARIEPPKPAVEETPSVAKAEEPKPTPSLPVGIAQFAYASDKVATGLKPLLDGLDWLEANQFRTVLHVRAPGEDDVAERRLVEKHNLKFVTLDVSPETLDRKTVEAFSRLVGDTSAQPLFVHDRDGTLAGGLWYLHFRLTEKLDDVEAQKRAARLGLKTDGEDAQKKMWLAIQKLVAQP